MIILFTSIDFIFTPWFGIEIVGNMPQLDINFSHGGRWPLSLSGVDYLQRFLPGDVESHSSSGRREVGSQLPLVP